MIHDRVRILYLLFLWLYYLMIILKTLVLRGPRPQRHAITFNSTYPNKMFTIKMSNFSSDKLYSVLYQVKRTDWTALRDFETLRVNLEFTYHYMVVILRLSFFYLSSHRRLSNDSMTICVTACTPLTTSACQHALTDAN